MNLAMMFFMLTEHSFTSPDEEAWYAIATREKMDGSKVSAPVMIDEASLATNTEYTFSDAWDIHSFLKYWFTWGFINYIVLIGLCIPVLVLRSLDLIKTS